MNRTDLIKSIAEKTGITQICAGSVLEVITKETTAALARGESVVPPSVPPSIPSHFSRISTIPCK